MSISIFVACPIGAEHSPERERSDQLMEHIICPVIEELLGKTGGVVTRADKIAKPGRISSQMMRELGESDLMIADLTGLNANVMYEVGVRQTLNKPLILMAAAGQEIPFDLLDYRTIFYRLNLSGLKPAQMELREYLQNVLSEEADPEYAHDAFKRLVLYGDAFQQAALFLQFLSDYFRDREKRAFYYRLDYNQFKFTPRTFMGSEDERLLDSLLYSFDTLGRMLRTKAISLNQARTLEFEIDRVLRNPEVRKYLEWLDHEVSTLNMSAKPFEDAKYLCEKLFGDDREDDSAPDETIHALKEDTRPGEGR